MWNLVLGLVFLIGGLSGKLALIGTGSTKAMAVAGAAMMAWGGYQLVQAKK